MKFKVYDELMNESDIMSHVFLNTTNKVIKNAEKTSKKKSKEELKNWTVDIELKIDGEEVDPREFYKEIFRQYTTKVREEAKELIKQKTVEKLFNASHKLITFADQLDTLIDNTEL